MKPVIGIRRFLVTRYLVLAVFPYVLVVCYVTLLLPATTLSEPYTSSCGAALEGVHKAREALIPYQRTIELARAREREAYGELTICTGGGIFSVEKATRCSEATWKAPERTKKVIDAEDQYLQGRKLFEQLFEEARLACLSDP